MTEPNIFGIDATLGLASAGILPDHNVGSEKFNMMRYGMEMPPNWMLVILCGTQEYLSDEQRALMPSTQTSLAEFLGTVQSKVSDAFKKYPGYFVRPTNRYIQLKPLPEAWMQYYNDLMQGNSGEQGYDRQGNVNTGQTPQMKKIGTRVSKTLANTEHMIGLLKDIRALIVTPPAPPLTSPVETKPARTEKSTRTNKRVYLADTTIHMLIELVKNPIDHKADSVDLMFRLLVSIIMELDKRKVEDVETRIRELTEMYSQQ